MYHLLGLCIVLAVFLFFNTVASTAASFLWRLLRKLPLRLSASARARFLFVLRIGPAIAALVWALAFMIPAYIVYEPRQANEVVGVKLGLVALGSGFGIALAVRRGIASWLATRRLVAGWIKDSQAFTFAGLSIPAYSIEHPFPVLAVVGAIRPRLFVGRQVLDSLTDAEIRAALIHEGGHLLARDNFKRVIVRACRDVLSIVPSGRLLDREWVAESEAAADDHAARKGRSVALDLASALVKIARMVPEHGTASLPSGAFLAGESLSEIAWRVQRLTLRTAQSPLPASRTLFSSVIGWASALLLTCLVSYSAFSPTTLARIHTATEYLVSSFN